MGVIDAYWYFCLSLFKCISIFVIYLSMFPSLYMYHHRVKEVPSFETAEYERLKNCLPYLAVVLNI